MTDIAVTSEPTNAEKIKGLRWSVAENAANAVFIQLTFFGSVFILFLNELQLNMSQIGLILSSFPFFGLISLFVTPRVARFGYKRTFIWFWTIRKFVTALLLLTPWVLSEFGTEATLFFVVLVVIGFGLCRAIAMVGYYPWNQEFVPDSMRGRYLAVNNVFVNVTGIISIIVASIVIENVGGMSRFTLLFAVGIAFGLLGSWLIVHVPGGAPVKGEGVEAPKHRDMLITFQDKNFWLFLTCLSLVTLAITPMFSFLPLFMKQEVGLSEGNVVLLQNGTLIGALMATILVGWSSDRYGGKPVMLSGLMVMLTLPLIWMFIPKNSSLSLPIALTAAVLQGGSHLTWVIGFGRLLYVNVIPPEHKAPYMAVYYAAIGVVGGMSQLLGGIILDFTAEFSGEFLSFNYNPFTPIFIAGFLLLIISIVLFQSVRSDTDVGGRQFIGFFLRGNTRLAFGSMIGYYRAKDEQETVVMTEKLGQAHSPLTVDELLEALIDPRFNVRFEAIVSIARTNPDPRFVEALENILHGTELALSGIAAWALGRVGDNHARDALRQGLDSEYRSIRAQCARALGTLGDDSIAPVLLERLKSESNKGLQIAYASALGRLSARDATETILNILDEMSNPGARMELALSLARIVGEERPFIHILRQIRNDPGTATAQILETAKRKLENDELSFSECIDLWAHEDLKAGSIALAGIIRRLPEDTFDTVQQQIMKHCTRHLESGHYESLEYLILALYIMEHY